MKTKKLLFGIVIGIGTSFATVNATIINVPSQQQSIQSAINVSSNGDTILVASGTYNERNITLQGKQIVLLSVSGANSTFINGGNNGGVFKCISGETFNTEINGFTIQNGQSNDGSAIHIINSSYLTVRNCVFKNNIGPDTWSHAAIYIGQSTNNGQTSPAGIHIYNCTFDNNSGYYGGAIFNEESGNTSSIFENCIFKNNSANRGGAVYGTRNSIFKYCVFYNNYSNGTVNCVIFNEGGYPTFQNCTFYNNTGYAFARNSSAQNTIIRNCIIQNNAGTFTEITNSNTINIEYSNEQSNNSGIGNFNQSALFVNTANNDFHLQSNSPCIDSGNPALIYNDPDGTRNDIGAYYYHQNLCNDIIMRDTIYFSVSDLTFQSHSPQVFLNSVDSLNTQIGNCDSLIFHYSKFSFNPSYFTDTLTINDTNFVTITDTNYVNQTIYDTTFVTITDTNFVNQTIYDTTFVTVTDTNYVTVYDTVTTYISVTDTLFINVNTVGLNNNTIINTIKVFPNPANTNLNLDFGNFTNLNGYSIKIYNSLSQVIYNQQITQQTETIDLSTFGGNGIYFLHVMNAQNNTVEIRKIVLQ